MTLAAQIYKFWNGSKREGWVDTRNEEIVARWSSLGNSSPTPFMDRRQRSDEQLVFDHQKSTLYVVKPKKGAA